MKLPQVKFPRVKIPQVFNDRYVVISLIIGIALVMSVTIHACATRYKPRSNGTSLDTWTGRTINVYGEPVKPASQSYYRR